MSEPLTLARAIGMTIEHIRTSRGLQKTKLADLAGVQRRAERDMELGNELPSLKNLVRVADVLGVSAGRILRHAEKQVVKARSFHAELHVEQSVVATLDADDANEETCSGCGNPCDRKGQRLCRICHAAWMKKYRSTHMTVPKPARARRNEMRNAA